MSEVKTKKVRTYSIAEDSDGTFILYVGGKARTRHANKDDAMKVVKALKLDEQAKGKPADKKEEKPEDKTNGGAK